jgi:hypothetical protein
MEKQEIKTIKPFFDTFAKDLGYKDYKELKDALGKEESGRANKGSMGNVGGPGGAGAAAGQALALVAFPRPAPARHRTARVG